MILNLNPSNPEISIGKLSAIKWRSSKGSSTQNCDQGFLLAGQGLRGDHHQGGERQISLVSEEAMETTKNIEGTGLCIEKYMANLTLQGISWETLEAGDRFRIGQGQIELTAVGKPCHIDCQWFQDHMQCTLTTSTAFAKVIKDGVIDIGDEVFRIPMRP